MSIMSITGAQTDPHRLKRYSIDGVQPAAFLRAESVEDVERCLV